MDFDISKIIGFDWDEGNLNKNRLKHNVTPIECEEVFYNKPLLIAYDKVHSKIEKRFQALGQTNNGRLLFVAFTIRNNKIRVISARDQNKKERVKKQEVKKYEKT